MRAIGKIAGAEDARKFADYLLTLGITTRLEAASDGWTIWVHREDLVPRAQQELASFVSNPADSRFRQAQQAAELIRKQQAQEDKKFRKNVIDLRGRWDRGNPVMYPLTIGLIAASVLVAMLSRLGEDERVITLMSIASYTREGNWIRWAHLQQIEHGEVWRLVTPIFIHFGLPHLLFNMWAMHNLGALIEIRRGTWRLALLVLATAIPSNLAQYFMQIGLRANGITFMPDPSFGGMSGVIYGLFGYTWMKTRYDSSVGLYLAPNTVVMMIAWLFLCMSGLIGSIANTAHLVGLIVGVVIGYAPVLWRKVMR